MDTIKVACPACKFWQNVSGQEDWEMNRRFDEDHTIERGNGRVTITCKICEGYGQLTPEKAAAWILSR